MAPPRKIVLEQTNSHQTFHNAQYVLLCAAMISAAVFIIVAALNDQTAGKPSEVTGNTFFKTTVSLAVIGMTILFINYYRSSSRTLYVLKILSHLAAIALVITASSELTDFHNEKSSPTASETNIMTFGGITIGLVGVGALLGIINAAHEFSFLF